jgi:hypothetical protein
VFLEAPKRDGLKSNKSVRCELLFKSPRIAGEKLIGKSLKKLIPEKALS